MTGPENMPPPLSYDVVMATRNRPEAVALSLPLLLGQTRLPEQILIVDSSEDAGAIEVLARDAALRGNVPVHYIRAGAGLTHQRNVGLARCGADVVLFPDDDSLLWRDCAAHLMAIYEADEERLVAGVAARPVSAAPPESPGDLGHYAAERTGRVRAGLQAVRQAVKEALGAANPFVSVGRRLNAQHPDPAWLGAQQAVVVPYMTGFRMSFRRAVIAATGFDEALQRYGWFEDIDASFSALRRGKLVTAGAARIYHHRAAAARADGYRMGVWAMLNRAYVVTKHVRANPALFASPAREAARLKRYCRARRLAYRLMARDAFGRDRARGAGDGLARMDRLLGAAPDQLEQTYRQLADG